MVVRLEEMAERDQNGRRLSLNAHPNDPRLKHNTTNYDSVVPSSHNFVRGNCDNYEYRHEWDVNNLKNGTHKFSHDQTQQSATQFPQSSTEKSMNGSINQCDPSAQLPQSPVNFAASATTHSRNMVNSTRNHNMGLNVPPPPMMLLPPPPPPPPPPPDKPVIPLFDASRPPPPLPAYIQENGKHKISAPLEAGPSKLRKSEHSKACGLCEKCVQRQIRIDMYKEEMEQLLAEDEKHSLSYKKKTQALEKGKLLIKSVVGEELYNFIEEYIEEVPDFFQSDDFVTQCHSATSSVSSKFSRQILLQLMKLMARNISESSLSLEDSLLPTLSRTTRRASVLESPPSAPAEDLLQEIANALASSKPPAPTPVSLPAASITATSKPSPGAPQYVGDWARGPPPGFPPPGVPPPGYNNAAPPPPMRYPPHNHYFPYHQ